MENEKGCVVLKGARLLHTQKHRRSIYTYHTVERVLGTASKGIDVHTPRLTLMYENVAVTNLSASEGRKGRA